MPITHLLSYEMIILNEEDDGTPILRITLPQEDYDKVLEAVKVEMFLRITGKKNPLPTKEDK